jgi:hypothetical protein
MYQADYNTLRQETKFSWSVSASYLALLEITGIKIKEMFLNSGAGIALYKTGRPLIRDMFGSEILLPTPMTPPISYGHINTLGAELRFPDDGEVNHGTLCNSIGEGIEILQKPIDFAKAGTFPFYMEYREKMQQAFPEEKIVFAYKSEGPLTTAYLLRRDEFFYDPYDNPELTKEFLKLITGSIIKFDHFILREMYGLPTCSSEIAGLADDCAAMFSHELWPEFVMPYLEQYFNAMTTGKRCMHIEDLRTEQLHFLEELQLVSYDPSVSPKINPKIISETIRIPFRWRLCNFHYPELSVREVADFVYQSAGDGASNVSTVVCHGMCNNETVKKVHSFIAACKDVECMFGQGASREEIRGKVSESGKNKFWSNWP